MATLRDIKRRIGSVQNTQQITSAMRMVSAAKLNRAQNNAKAAQPYAEALRKMVVTLAGGMGGDDHPLFQVREEGGTLVLAFFSDRGLCGGFNTNLVKALSKALDTNDQFKDAELGVFGRVGADYFRRHGYNVTGYYTQMPEAERRVKVKEVVDEAVQRFTSGELRQVFLAYNHFQNPMTQTPTIIPLLPIIPPETVEGSGEASVDEREPLFEPDRDTILDQLLPSYLVNQGTNAHLNTEAGEHGARMVAMEGATKNAKDMISKLTLQYNRLRQAAITKELIEIINGAQSL